MQIPLAKVDYKVLLLSKEQKIQRKTGKLRTPKGKFSIKKATSRK